MNNQQAPEKTVTDEVVETLIKRTELFEKELIVKNEVLLTKEKETQALITNFKEKLGNMTVQAPRPDMSIVETELHKGLTQINQTLEKWSRPLKKEYHFSLFPGQLKSVEYVKAVLTRIILGLLGLVFLVFAYLLLDKRI